MSTKKCYKINLESYWGESIETRNGKLHERCAHIYGGIENSFDLDKVTGKCISHSPNCTSQSPTRERQFHSYQPENVSQSPNPQNVHSQSPTHKYSNYSETSLIYRKNVNFTFFPAVLPIKQLNKCNVTYAVVWPQNETCFLMCY
jgi:hypothetical protein